MIVCIGRTRLCSDDHYLLSGLVRQLSGSHTWGKLFWGQGRGSDTQAVVA